MLVNPLWSLDRYARSWRCLGTRATVRRNAGTAAALKSVISMKKAYWIDGRLLTERDLQDIRTQLESFKTVTAISDEMRDVIETEWPELAAKLLPPGNTP
jgi:hypothetical protein